MSTLIDYLEEALEGLDTVVERIQRVRTPAAEPDKKARNSGIIEERKRNYFGKSLNISRKESAVDEPEFNINQYADLVYDLEDGGSRQDWEPGLGGEEGSDDKLQQSEPSAPVPGQGEDWNSIAAPVRRTAAGMVRGGMEQSGEAGHIPASAPVLAASEMEWTERADRMFRRDSRRYDGGFYLY